MQDVILESLGDRLRDLASRFRGAPDSTTEDRETLASPRGISMQARGAFVSHDETCMPVLGTHTPETGAILRQQWIDLIDELRLDLLRLSHHPDALAS